MPGDISLVFYKSGTGSERTGLNDIYASLGDTISIDVFIRNFSQVPVSAIEVYVTIDSRYFDIVPQGINTEKNKYEGQIKPFLQGEYLKNAYGSVQPFGNNTWGDKNSPMDNGHPGWQLNYAEITGPDVGFGRPVSKLLYGVVCTFKLVAIAPCDSIPIKLDSNQFNMRVSQYYYPNSNDSYSFQYNIPTYISVSGITIFPPLPDIFMAPGASDSTLDLDDHVGLSSIPDSLLIWSSSGNKQIGVSIDPKTHIATYTTPSGFRGFEDIVFTVGNGKGVNASDTMRVVVDSPPKLLPNAMPDTLRITEDILRSVLHLPSFVEDKDDSFANLRWFFRASGGKVTPSVAADSLFLKGIQDFNGNETLRISVYDSFGVGDSLSVPVRVLPVNDPPALKKIPDVKIERNKQYVLNMGEYASDVDGDMLDITWKAPEHLEIRKNGMQLTLKGAPGFLGSEKVHLTVSDPPGLSVTDSLTVSVVAAKDPPVWSRIPKIGFPQNRADSSLALWDYVSDPDDGPALLTFVFANLDNVDSVYVNPRTGRTTFYDLDNAPGWDRVTVTAFDPDGNRASVQFPVFIGPADGTPIVAGIPDTTMVAGSQVQWIDLDDYYYDVDNTDNQMRWSWGRQASADSSVTVAINPVTRVVYLRGLGAERTGMNRLFFTVTDPGNKFADDICIVSAVSLNRPMLDLPSKIGFVAGGKQELDLDDYVQDSVYPRTELSWTWSGNRNAGITPETPDAFRTRPVAFSGPASWVGWERVVFEVKNPLGGSAQDTLLVFSASSDGTPVAGGLDVVFLRAGTGVYVNLDNYFFDADTPDHLMRWTVSGGDSVTAGIDPVTRTAYFNAPSESWEGQNTFTFTLSDPENHTATMRTTVVVSGAVIRNAFSLNIFRNPMQEDYMDVYIQSIVDLSASPALSVRTARDSTAVALETVTAGYYHGGYLLPLDLSMGEKGTAELRVKGRSKDGKEVSAVKMFGYGRIDSGGGKIALSGFSLEIPPDALRKPELITVIPAGGDSPSAKPARGGVQLSGERFSVGPGALRSEKPMTVAFALSGDIRGAGIYRLVQDTPLY
ncbi:MAG: Ig-like domain-containing protein, partial [Candidatus Latescibacterota bacterium]